MAFQQQVSKDSKISWISESLCIGLGLGSQSDLPSATVSGRLWHLRQEVPFRGPNLRVHVQHERILRLRGLGSEI